MEFAHRRERRPWRSAAARRKLCAGIAQAKETYNLPNLSFRGRSPWESPGNMLQIGTACQEIATSGFALLAMTVVIDGLLRRNRSSSNGIAPTYIFAPRCTKPPRFFVGTGAVLRCVNPSESRLFFRGWRRRGAPFPHFRSRVLRWCRRSAHRAGHFPGRRGWSSRQRTGPPPHW